MSGSSFLRTSENAERTRGDASTSPGWYDGSAVTTAAIALSASLPRPSASRQSERYCSIDLRSVTVVPVSAGLRSLSTASASS